ncbi:hypothetical protein BKA70DRAFT_1216773 [Coprinopsis sp. MPI-PUGE-AT-0042]|nr:hypothetical protein BKA70DRAFT_1216773 [Coprinopsis sp. MPI-PUGE-AT-0042]
MAYSPTPTKLKRRGARPHRLPSKFRNSPSNPFSGPSPRAEKAKGRRRSILKSTRSLFSLSPKKSSTSFPDSDDGTPIKVKLEETTPIAGSLFSSPLMRMRTGGQSQTQSLTEEAGDRELVPVAPESQLQTAEFSTPETFSPAKYSNSRSSPAEDEASEILDGIAQNPWEFEAPIPSPDRPAMASSSDFEEIRALDLPVSFFHENKIRKFNPQVAPKSNIGALCDFGSRFPVGVNTYTFLRLFRQCTVCLHVVYVDNCHQHSCATNGEKTEPLPTEDSSFVTYMTAAGCKGVTEDQLHSLSARCSTCDRLVVRAQPEGGWRHHCQVRWA